MCLKRGSVSFANYAANGSILDANQHSTRRTPTVGPIEGMVAVAVTDQELAASAKQVNVDGADMHTLIAQLCPKAADPPVEI